MNKTLIPEDNSVESIKIREKIIRDFYREWKEQNPSQRKCTASPPYKAYNNKKGILVGCLLICPSCVEEGYTFV